ncbi:MAG: isoprenylcysteine carboxylmethyltransferase family protein [Candidatus Dormiibacterota bacterium]
MRSGVDGHGPAQGNPVSTLSAGIGTALAFPFGPGLIPLLIPWMITHWQAGAPYPLAVRTAGLVLIVAGGILTVATFARFVTEGRGTPFPTDPPTSRKVMVGGPYRYVRNPMYVGFILAIVGQAFWLSRPVLFIYTLALLVFLVAFVHFWEERTMAKRYGAEYESYCKEVPGWWPRWLRRTS